MVRFGNNLKSLKVYGFTIGFYALLALILIVPVLSQRKSAAEVKRQFAVVQKQVAAQKPIVAAAAITGQPVNLRIERLGINLQVDPGVYDAYNRSWTLSSTNVFVSTLKQPNPVVSTSATDQPLTTVFYGHKITSVIGNTTNLAPGDILHITTDTGYTFTYYYDHDQVVSPTDTAILSTPNTTPTVALVTCSGFFSQDRRIMYFSPLGTPTKNNTHIAGSTL